MKSIFNLIANLLWINTKTGLPSHTKFWSNVGYGCMCFTFVYAVLYGSKIEAMLWALFGIVVIGNHSVLQLFQRGGGNSEPPKQE